MNRIENISQQLHKAATIAESHGGKCISNNYVNNRSKLMFRCAHNHEWETNLHNISTGNSWCPHCLYKSQTEKIALVSNIVAKHNGLLLNYENNKCELKCEFGHKWQASYTNIVNRKSWCPYCKASFSENVCRQYLEYLFQKEFPKSRPKWLVGTKGKLLELDGYCEELKLAFEHHGMQHYKDIAHFRESSASIQNRDIIKRNICHDYGISIIEIPALFYKTKLTELHLVIANQLYELKIKYNNKLLLPATEVIDLSLVNKKENLAELNKIINIIKQKGGTLHSDTYAFNKSVLKVSCSNGHQWHTKAINIKKGTWCPLCAHQTTLTLDIVIDYAKKYNIECLSTNYVNNSSKMNWRCFICGNEWVSTYNNLSHRKGCPKCKKVIAISKRKANIEEYKKAALSKGGICLSEKINTCREKLKFQCANDHIWEAAAHSVKNSNRWCPLCAKLK